MLARLKWWLTGFVLVATPMEWGEALSGGMDPRRYTIRNIFRRLGGKDDPWAGMGSTAVSVSTLMRKLEAIAT